MSKAREKNYFQRIGPEGVARSLNKPFSEDESGALLSQIAAIMTLLPPPPAKVLDMGCGTGWTSVFFARRGHDVVGQDIAADAIGHARKHVKDLGLKNIRFIDQDYEDMKVEPEFDAVVFFDSLHHAVDETAALRTAYRALKLGGICITSEPGKGHVGDPHTKSAVAQYGVTEKDMPPSRIKRAGRQAGFSKFEVLPDPALVARAAFRRPVSPKKRFLTEMPVVGSLIRGGSLLQAALKKRSWGLVVLTK